MIKEIIRDCLILKRKATEATRDDIGTANDLLDTLKANSDRCVGMAANMIGEPKRIIVASVKGGYVVMLNPKLVDFSARTYEAVEGCLSLNGERKAIRYKTIVVEYYDIRFNKKKKTFTGGEAQIIQHELDHLEGILI